ncbi:hypothetical protein GUITHDRAFT_161701 [Guillardia theta CCMP2712]|uniref:Uncharacterized protein n=1 Tax=Guillardia theta (strain CCMP2712) TaxID=905079 RepID=L1JRL4_GUITC|nr:hypothetical protein GUITHDRAFT_161701 [Guillardia theta CCMP2712]EKX50733.1 hypothetical protein GUITHDRAFT_161701 [Guillardia theta CCMP2712]|mmetsp:Transcript_29288/g.94066  ORF Transcript_29288/g.94066 Transcript_29288/m.94066 type:complete len:341 (-) Transcript_29288:73-1095(-)|eukprot:XP_005837713.1 hypothetical protein GUITHDRAFT_161701 [Guillardia theta CCMP2712]
MAEVQTRINLESPAKKPRISKAADDEEEWHEETTESDLTPSKGEGPTYALAGMKIYHSPRSEINDLVQGSSDPALSSHIEAGARMAASGDVDPGVDDLPEEGSQQSGAMEDTLLGDEPLTETDASGNVRFYPVLVKSDGTQIPVSAEYLRRLGIRWPLPAMDLHGIAQQFQAQTDIHSTSAITGSAHRSSLRMGSSSSTPQPRSMRQGSDAPSLPESLTNSGRGQDEEGDAHPSNEGGDAASHGGEATPAAALQTGEVLSETVSDLARLVGLRQAAPPARLDSSGLAAILRPSGAGSEAVSGTDERSREEASDIQPPVLTPFEECPGVPRASASAAERSR